MVFAWSHLTDGDPGYTLAQVSLNDLIMLVGAKRGRLTNETAPDLETTEPCAAIAPIPSDQDSTTV